MQKKIDLLDEEKQKLEKNIEDHIYKEKEKKAQIAFEKQEKEEHARKRKEEWESKMLGIGVCTHEKDFSESAPLSNSFNRCLCKHFFSLKIKNKLKHQTINNN